jgi:AraC family transcriptional regulator, melibiose operon regulatory protein
VRILELGFSAGMHQEMGLYNTGHRHNDIELNFLTSGEMIYAFAGKQHLVSPLRLTVFWAAIPHRLIYVAPSSRLYWVTIPLSFFTNWDLPNGMVKSVLNGSFLQEPSAVFEQLDLYWFRQWYEDLSSMNKMHSKTVLLEIEARLRRLAAELVRSHSTVHTHVAHHGHNTKLHTAQQVAQYITQHYAETIDCKAIADAVGIHPGYASRVFSETFDIGIIEYLTQYRVAAAQKLLLMTDLQVKQIAFDVGFGSISRFYAAFKQLCGMSPEKYRLTLTETALSE